MRSPAPLRVELKPSRLAASMIAIGVVASAFLVASLPGEWWLRAPMCLAIGAYGLWLVRSRAQGTTPTSVIAIELDADMRASFTERRGRRIAGLVKPDSYVSAVLTTIVIHAPGARRSRAIAILPDMLASDDFRRLRVLLRFGRTPQR